MDLRRIEYGFLIVQPVGASRPAPARAAADLHQLTQAIAVRVDDMLPDQFAALVLIISFEQLLVGEEDQLAEYVHLVDAHGAGPADVFVARARAAVQDERHFQLPLQLREQVEIQLGRALVETVRRADRNGQTVHTGLIDEGARLLGLGEGALALVQGMQPCGVGARSLRECLEIQARGSADYPLIRQILRDGSGRLERRDTAYFARLCAVSRAKIEQIFVYLASLHPFPGAGYHDDTAIAYIFPDISIRRCADGLEITLSQGDSLLRLDTGYYQELRQAARHDKVSRAFVRTQYGEAREWVHILQIRQTTLSRFAHCLAEAQYAYFAQGSGYMRPLNLNQIAERMDMHPSTVCRLAKDKYIQTDWGTIQAGALFTGAFYTEEGMIAADTVKNLLCRLVRSENPARPASDQELAGAVERKLGIQISRRTIAKYRAELGIACRRERKTTAI